MVYETPSIKAEGNSVSVDRGDGWVVTLAGSNPRADGVDLGVVIAGAEPPNSRRVRVAPVHVARPH
jgi:hypothetical protein